MTKISRSPSIEKKRIHSNYVERNRYVSKASSVGAVTPVNPVFNNVNYSSANHLMYSDALYDNLMDLKYEYLNFYHHERNLQKAISELGEDNSIPLENMNNLVGKYNLAIEALENFDIHLRTDFTKNIKDIIHQHKDDLDRIGISIIDEKLLKIDELKFQDLFNNSKNDLERLFDPIQDMILKLYDSFRNIKGPYSENFDEKYPEILKDDNRGIVLDEKS